MDPGTIERGETKPKNFMAVPMVIFGLLNRCRFEETLSSPAHMKWNSYSYWGWNSPPPKKNNNNNLFMRIAVPPAKTGGSSFHLSCESWSSWWFTAPSCCPDATWIWPRLCWEKHNAAASSTHQRARPMWVKLRCEWSKLEQINNNLETCGTGTAPDGVLHCLWQLLS